MAMCYGDSFYNEIIYYKTMRITNMALGAIIVPIFLFLSAIASGGEVDVATDANHVMLTPKGGSQTLRFQASTVQSDAYTLDFLFNGSLYATHSLNGPNQDVFTRTFSFPSLPAGAYPLVVKVIKNGTEVDLIQVTDIVYASDPDRATADVNNDPTQNADVSGIASAQHKSATSFAWMQIYNISGRLKRRRTLQNHVSGRNFNLSLSVPKMPDREERNRYMPLASKNALASLNVGALASSKEDESPLLQPDWALWSEGFVKFGKLTSQQSGENTTAGVTFGMDRRHSDFLTYGLAFDYARDREKIGKKGRAP